MEKTDIVVYIFIALLTLLLFVVATILTIIYSRSKIVKSKHRLLQKEIDHRKELMQKTLETQENERAEISGRLHDEVGSKLAGLKVTIQRNLNAFDESDTGLVTESLEALISTTRDISHQMGLYPLDRLGLGLCMKGLLHDQLKANGFDINLEIDDGLNLGRTEEQQLFRILQELTTNTLKHSKGDYVSIGLHKSNEERGWIFTYLDKGTGEQVKLEKGFGLRSIESRAESLGCTLRLNSVVDISFSIEIKSMYD